MDPYKSNNSSSLKRPYSEVSRSGTPNSLRTPERYASSKSRLPSGEKSRTLNMPPPNPLREIPTDSDTYRERTETIYRSPYFPPPTQSSKPKTSSPLNSNINTPKARRPTNFHALNQARSVSDPSLTQSLQIASQNTELARYKEAAVQIKAMCDDTSLSYVLDAAENELPVVGDVRSLASRFDGLKNDIEVVELRYNRKLEALTMEKNGLIAEKKDVLRKMCGLKAKITSGQNDPKHLMAAFVNLVEDMKLNEDQILSEETFVKYIYAEVESSPEPEDNASQADSNVKLKAKASAKTAPRVPRNVYFHTDIIALEAVYVDGSKEIDEHLLVDSKLYHTEKNAIFRELVSDATGAAGKSNVPSLIPLAAAGQDTRVRFMLMPFGGTDQKAVVVDTAADIVPWFRELKTMSDKQERENKQVVIGRVRVFVHPRAVEQEASAYISAEIDRTWRETYFTKSLRPVKVEG